MPRARVPGPLWAGWSALLGASLLVLTGSAGADPGSTHRTIVFVSPAGEELETALRDALTAQLAGGEAEVVFEHFATSANTLRLQVGEARSLASAHDAVGVYWLDAQVDRDWLVYLAEPSGDRVLVRRLTVDGASVSSTTEAVAIITRQSAEALIAGQTIGMQPIVVPPDSDAAPVPAPAAHLVPPTPPPPDVRPRGLGVFMGYAGDSPTTEITWQSGMRLGADYRTRSGLYGGAGYVFLKEIVVQQPAVSFQVTRTPLDFHLGVILGRRRLAASLELRGIVDLMRRHDQSTARPFVAQPDSTRAALWVAPRLGVRYTLMPTFELVATAGCDVAINGFTYVSVDDGRTHTLLESPKIRPSLEVGGAFWP